MWEEWNAVYVGGMNVPTGDRRILPHVVGLRDPLCVVHFAVTSFSPTRTHSHPHVFRPRQASNMWGILGHMIRAVQARDDGKYLFLKDPNKTVLPMPAFFFFFFFFCCVCPKRASCALFGR